MRIAQVVPPGLHAYSGALTALVYLSAALAERGHHVDLWQFGPWPDDTEEFDAILERAGVGRAQLPAPGRFGYVGANAMRSVAARAVDVAHLHGVFNPFNNWIARRLAVPYVISPHGGYAPGTMAYHAGRKRLFGRLFELPMLQAAAAVCALTDSEAEDLRRFGVTTRIEIVPNGVAPVIGRADARRFRQLLPMSPDQLLAIYVGRLDIRQKRLDALLRGVSGAPDWHAVLIGGAFRRDLPRLQTLVASSGAHQRLHLLGPRRAEALQEALAAADLFVLLSRSEGLPMALLEAAAQGVPALVSPEVEQATGIAAHRAGWVTPPQRLAETLTALAGNDEAEWMRRRGAARAYADGYRWPAVAATCELVYQRAVAGSRRRKRPEPARASGQRGPGDDGATSRGG